jgi:GT2 family glycosyltransferase
METSFKWGLSSLQEVISFDALTGASLLVPVSVFQRIGLLDSRRFSHGFADFEFTRRASLAGFRCLVAAKSRVYTDSNPNYEPRYYIHSTRMDYLRNLFENRRFGYGFVTHWRLSFMHRDPVRGTLLLARRYAGLIKRSVLKLILPKKLLWYVVGTRHAVEEDRGLDTSTPTDR